MSHRNPTAGARTPGPFVDALERRTLLSASFASLHHGVVSVHGTSHDDQIVIAVDAQGPSKLDVTVNGKTTQFDISRITAVKADGKSGNDLIDMDETHGAMSDDATLVGGAGNDTIMGGSGHERLVGSGGDDSLQCGHGDDSVQAGAGDDTMVGGDGDDSLDGGDGDDLLEGGSGRCQMRGDGGDDALMSGNADDHMDGGWGADTFDTDNPDQIDHHGGRDRIESGSGSSNNSGSASSDNGGSGSVTSGSGDSHEDH